MIVILKPGRPHCNFMKILSIIILIAFVLFRNSFTILKGKRSRTNVTLLIYWGRKLIEIFISFLIPLLLILEIIKTHIYAPIYYVGLAISILGLLLMALTRFYREKDWGFMGDKSGDKLFVGGTYKITRHPYYIGAIFVGIGLYLQLNYFLILAMLPVIIFIVYVMKKEDNFLEQKFGKEYLDYKNKVGIFPWFY